MTLHFNGSTKSDSHSGNPLQGKTDVILVDSRVRSNIGKGAITFDTTVLNTSRAGSGQSLWPWPALLIVFFAINFIVVAITIVLASTDPSFAIEPNYYNRAINWDNEMARRQASEALGWHVVCDDAAVGELLALRLTDREGNVVSGAYVQVEAFHQASASQRTLISLVETESGLYRAALPSTRTGYWELRIVARRGTEAFATTHTYTVDAGGSSQ